MQPPNHMVSPGIKIFPGDELLKQKIQVDIIAEEVGLHFGILVVDMMQNNRKREIVVARQTTMYMMKKFTIWSYKSIGEFFTPHTTHGKPKDHTTVIHSIKVVNDLKDIDRNFREQLITIEQRITRRHIHI